MWSEHRFISFDKTPILYHRLESSKNPKAILLVVHGMGEHGGRYRPIAEFLSAMDINTYAIDLRGFGKSGGGQGFVQNYQDFHKDILALHSLIVRTAAKSTPVFILGHSFGGLLASSYLAFQKNPGATGLILSSPLFGLALDIPQWKHGLAMFLANFLPNFTENSTIHPQVLTHDKSYIVDYLKDPYINHRLCLRLYQQMRLLMQRGPAIANALKLPTLVLQAGDDHVVSRPKTEAFYADLASPDKNLIIYENLYHEILNELDRQKVYSQIALWISQKISS